MGSRISPDGCKILVSDNIYNNITELIAILFAKISLKKPDLYMTKGLIATAYQLYYNITL